MNESVDDSTVRALHRLVEHYTPDGTLGRSLLGGTALLFAPFLFFGGIVMLTSGFAFVTFLMGLFGFLLGVPAFLVGLMTLWPVYLSLIGNVESPAAYPEGAAKPGETRGSPEAVLKRRYAAGELTREEFERRLDDVIGTRRTANGESRVDDRERPHRERSRSR